MQERQIPNLQRKTSTKQTIQCYNIWSDIIRLYNNKQHSMINRSFKFLNPPQNNRGMFGGLGTPHLIPLEEQCGSNPLLSSIEQLRRRRTNVA